MSWQSSRGWLKPICQKAILLTLCAIAQIAGSSQAGAAPLALPQFAQFAGQCGSNVAVSTLAAIAQTESGLNPLSVYDNTTRIAADPQTAADAATIASRLIAAGHSVDVGLMQINSANFMALGLTVETALDSCHSIAAGAAILTSNYAGGIDHQQQQAALRVALSRYNTGDPVRGFMNGYVHKVEMSNVRVVPALDLDGTSVSVLPQAAFSRPITIAAMPAGSSSSWEVFPSDPEPAFVKNAVGSEDGAVALADAGKGPAAAVVNYPGPLFMKTSEVP